MRKTIRGEMVQVLMEGGEVRVVHVRGCSTRHGRVRSMAMSVSRVLLGGSSYSCKRSDSVGIMSLQVHTIMVGHGSSSRGETLLQRESKISIP